MKTKKQLNLTIIAIYAAAIILVSFVLGPIFSRLDSNTLTKDSIWTDLIYYAIRIITFAVYPLIISLTVYSVFRFGLNGNKAALALPLVCTLIRYSVDLIINLFTKSIASVSLISTLVYTLIDFAIIFITAIFAENRITPQIEADKIRAKASRNLNIDYQAPKYLPFSSMFDMKNPVLLSSVVGSGCFTALNLISRIRYDIAFGAPASFTDGFGMMLAYLGDITIGALTYFAVIFLLLSYIPKKES
jgi:hypothetical protein